MKAIRQSQTRNIIDSYNKEDISYSRMNEMFNELAEDFAMDFFNWYQDDMDKNRIKELLEIYKKEKGI